jgi:argininosuccinate lyase
MKKGAEKPTKLWGGRFTAKTAKSVDSFTESVSFDKRLWSFDIEGSIAHAEMLGRQGIIPRQDAQEIVRALREIGQDITEGRFKFSQELEDVHMNIEAALIGRIGEAGRRLHTARSRNDQIALDLRLYLMSESLEIESLIRRLQLVLADAASGHISVILPGYTHLQRAQPVLLSHHLLAYAEMLGRDAGRLSDCLRRTDSLPLGACALAGTSLPIDRNFVAKKLGFNSISRNSIDSVSDRDFALEFLSFAALLMMHLSRLCEELVLWSGWEFGFLELPDEFTTGSSIMPQKKNPDVAELVRGKTGRIYGDLMSLLTIMKGLPLSYNRDMQEDKVPLFDAVDTVKSCLNILAEMIPGIRFNSERMKSTAGDGYSTATDLAEYLVIKGLPFRTAHEVTGKIVRHCVQRGISLEELSLKDFKVFSPLISADVFSCLSPAESIRRKRSSGSTAVSEVRKQIREIRRKKGSRRRGFKEKKRGG